MSRVPEKTKAAAAFFIPHFGAADDASDDNAKASALTAVPLTAIDGFDAEFEDFEYGLPSPWEVEAEENAHDSVFHDYNETAPAVSAVVLDAVGEDSSAEEAPVLHDWQEKPYKYDWFMTANFAKPRCWPLAAPATHYERLDRSWYSCFVEAVQPFAGGSNFRNGSQTLYVKDLTSKGSDGKYYRVRSIDLTTEAVIFLESCGFDRYFDFPSPDAGDSSSSDSDAPSQSETRTKAKRISRGPIKDDSTFRLKVGEDGLAQELATGGKGVVRVAERGMAEQLSEGTLVLVRALTQQQPSDFRSLALARTGAREIRERVEKINVLQKYRQIMPDGTAFRAPVEYSLCARVRYASVESVLLAGVLREPRRQRPVTGLIATLVDVESGALRSVAVDLLAVSTIRPSPKIMVTACEVSVDLKFVCFHIRVVGDESVKSEYVVVEFESGKCVFVHAESYGSAAPFFLHDSHVLGISTWAVHNSTLHHAVIRFFDLDRKTPGLHETIQVATLRSEGCEFVRSSRSACGLPPDSISLSDNEYRLPASYKLATVEDKRLEVLCLFEAPPEQTDHRSALSMLGQSRRKVAPAPEKKYEWRIIQSVVLPERIVDAEFSADDSRLVCCSLKRVVEIDVATGARLLEFQFDHFYRVANWDGKQKLRDVRIALRDDGDLVLSTLTECLTGGSGGQRYFVSCRAISRQHRSDRFILQKMRMVDNTLEDGVYTDTIQSYHFATSSRFIYRQFRPKTKYGSLTQRADQCQILNLVNSSVSSVRSDARLHNRTWIEVIEDRNGGAHVEIQLRRKFTQSEWESQRFDRAWEEEHWTTLVVKPPHDLKEAKLLREGGMKIESGGRTVSLTKFAGGELSRDGRTMLLLFGDAAWATILLADPERAGGETAMVVAHGTVMQHSSKLGTALADWSCGAVSMASESSGTIDFSIALAGSKKGHFKTNMGAIIALSVQDPLKGKPRNGVAEGPVLVSHQNFQFPDTVTKMKFSRDRRRIAVIFRRVCAILTFPEGHEEARFELSAEGDKISFVEGSSVVAVSTKGSNGEVVVFDHMTSQPLLRLEARHRVLACQLSECGRLDLLLVPSAQEVDKAREVSLTQETRSESVQAGDCDEVVVLRFHLSQIPSALLLKQSPKTLRTLVALYPHISHARLLSVEEDLLVGNSGPQRKLSMLQNEGPTILRAILAQAYSSRKSRPKCLHRALALCEVPIAPLPEQFFEIRTNQTATENRRTKRTATALGLAVSKRHLITARAVARALIRFLEEQAKFPLWTNLLEEAIVPLAQWQPALAGEILEAAVLPGQSSISAAPILQEEVFGSLLPPNGDMHNIWENFVNRAGPLGFAKSSKTTLDADASVIVKGSRRTKELEASKMAGGATRVLKNGPRRQFFSSGPETSVASFVLAIPGLASKRMGKKSGVRHTCFQKLAATHAHEVFETRAMTAALKFKWRTYARRWFLRELYLFLALLLTTTTSFVCIATHTRNSRLPPSQYPLFQLAPYTTTLWGVAGLIAAVPSILLLVLVYLPREVSSMYRGRGSYIRDPYNILDVAMMVAIPACTFSLFAFPVAGRYLSSVSLLLLWSSTLWFLRGHPTTTNYVGLVGETIAGLGPFALVMFLLLTAFLFAFIVLLPETDAFSTPWRAAMTVFRFSLFDFEADNFFEDEVLGSLLLVVLCSFAGVILLNLLIGQMTATLERFSTHAVVQSRIQLAESVMTVERIISKSALEDPNHFPHFTFILTPEEAEEQHAATRAGVAVQLAGLRLALDEMRDNQARITEQLAYVVAAQNTQRERESDQRSGQHSEPEAEVTGSFSARAMRSSSVILSGRNILPKVVSEV